jgi:hypothetical protein
VVLNGTDTPTAEVAGPTQAIVIASNSASDRFDQAKAIIAPEIARYCDGDIAPQDVMVKCDEVAANHHISKHDLRGWAKREMAKFDAAPDDRGRAEAVDPVAKAASDAAEAAAAWVLCAPLAQAPDIIRLLFDIAHRLGIVSDRRGVLSVYLTMISRLLRNPVRMLRKGASAAGKSYVIEKLLALLNPDDYLIFTGASAKALIYSQEDFSHRLLFFGEAVSLEVWRGTPDEMAMFLRELISSGRIRYATVQADERGRLRGITVEKDGPISLIVTTARENIEEELLTRMLVTVTDESDKQTAAILNSAALAAAGQGPQPVAEGELAIWRAHQNWLRLGGTRNVVVPYAGAIAALAERKALRIRRDIGNVISLVMAPAMLHRARRATDAEGRVIAELIDYAYAIQSLGEGLDELIHGDTAATEKVRQVVQGELNRAQRTYGRANLATAFRTALHTHLNGAGMAHAAIRLVDARKSKRAEPRLGTIFCCIAVATVDGTDAAAVVSATDRQRLYRAACKSTKATARAVVSNGPLAVELSTQRLGTLLGIGRQAARVRLANAIEADAVKDVGATDPTRNRTAPKLLAPGAQPRPPSPADQGRRGVFPSVEAVRVYIPPHPLQIVNQATKRGVT